MSKVPYMIALLLLSSIYVVAQPSSFTLAGQSGFATIWNENWKSVTGSIYVRFRSTCAGDGVAVMLVADTEPLPSTAVYQWATSPRTITLCFACYGNTQTTIWQPAVTASNPIAGVADSSCPNGGPSIDYWVSYDANTGYMAGGTGNVLGQNIITSYTFPSGANRYRIKYFSFLAGNSAVTFSNIVYGQPCGVKADPSISGCSDGTREWFFNIDKHPFIAGCSGAWSVTGLRTDANTVRNTPSCGRANGNTGTNLNGTGCSAVDLCAAGWSICSGAMDIAVRSSTTDCDTPTNHFDTCSEDDAFFASAQGSSQFSWCQTGRTDDIYGCGKQVTNLTMYSEEVNADVCGPFASSNFRCNCDAADKLLSYSPTRFPYPWSIDPAFSSAEQLRIFKQSNQLGGVLCCKNDVSQCPAGTYARRVDVGCADGTREYLETTTTYPDIAGCSGGWSVPGIVSGRYSVRTRNCSSSGNSSPNSSGQGCTAADLCEPGWKICDDARDMLMTTGSAFCPVPTTVLPAGSQFFASAMSVGHINCTVNVNPVGNTTGGFGCGRQNQGSYCRINGGFSQNAFTGTNYATLDGSWNPGVGLPRTTPWNASRVFKTSSSGGGVLCCRIKRMVCLPCVDGTCSMPRRPTVMRLTPSTSTTAGAITVTIDGFYFGIKGTVSIGGTICTQTTAHYFSDQRILCTLPAGTGNNVSVSVTSDYMGSGPANFSVFSYLPPTITSITGVRQTQGGNLITISGANFGLSTAAAQVTIRFGLLSCPISGTGRSHTVIQCTLPAGTGSLNVSVVIMGQASNNFTFIYNPPTITGVSPASWTVGGRFITITGTNFGPDAIVRINNASCTGVSPNTARNQLFCYTPPGSGTQNRVFVSVGGQSLTWSGVYAYARPSITFISNYGRFWTQDVTSLNLTLNGYEFGDRSLPLTVTIGSYGTFPVFSHNHNTAVFGVNPLWTVSSVVTLNVDGQTSTCSDLTYNCAVYLHGAVVESVRGCSDVSSSTVTTECPVNGGRDITIIGSNFANASLSTVTVGPTICPIKNWTYTVSGTKGTYSVICTLQFNPSGGAQLVSIRGATGQPYVVYRAPKMVYKTLQRCPNSIYYDVFSNFSLTQNQSAWSYLYRQSGIFYPMTLSGGSWIGTSVDLSIRKDIGQSPFDIRTLQVFMQPEVSADAVIAWLSPSSGFANIFVSMRDAYVACGNGIIASIWHNQILLSQQTLANGNSTGFTLNLQRAIASSDYVYVIVNSNGEKNCDPTAVNVSITLLPSPSSSIFTSGSLVDFNPYGGDCVTFRVDNIDGASSSQVQVVYGAPGNVDIPSSLWLSCVNIRVADPWIFCDTTVGIGRSLYFKVQVYQQWSVVSSDPDTVSYRDVFLVSNSIRKNVSQAGVSSYTASTNNPIWMYFDILNLPPNSWLWPYLKTVYGSSNTTGQKEYACSIFQVNQMGSAIVGQCLLAKGIGITEENVFQIIVFNYRTANSDFTFQYPLAPKIDQVTGCTQDGIRTIDCPTEGGTELTISGNYFCDFTTPNCSMQVLVGTQYCLPTYNSTKMITCSLPVGNGIGLPMQLLETIYGDKGFQVSKLNIVSYALATIDTVRGCPDIVNVTTVNCSRYNPTRVTITGSNFGKDRSSVYLNGFPCYNLAHDIFFPHRLVTCTISPGQVVGASILLVQSEGALSANSGFASYYQCDPGTIGNSRDLNCTSCNAGFYTPVAGSTSCSECVYGTFASTNGSSFCADCLAGYYSRLNATTCPSCDPGTYSSTDGSFNCIKCDAGYYNPVFAQSTCLKCNEGRYAGALGLSNCTFCGPGTFAVNPGSVSCKLCAQGMYIGISGATGCELCPAGKIPGKTDPIHEGNSTCLDCAPGFYSSAKGQPACLPCPKGSFSDQNASTTCFSCVSGYNSSDVGMSYCGSCDAGKFAPGSGNIVCISCNSGSFNTMSNSSSCNLCLAGQYQFNTAQSFCDLCSPGFQNNLKGQAQCTKCRSGYVANEGQELCIPCSPGQYPLNEYLCGDCEAGSFTASFGQQVCALCEAGQYQPSKGQQFCRQCAAGYAQPEIGQKTCKACDPGKFAAALEQVLCEKCPQGRSTNTSASIDCAICNPGSYQNLQGSSSCLLCPPGNFSILYEQAGCPACERGTYAPDHGSTTCLSCLKGFYQDATGQSDCQECAIATYNRDVKATICTECEPGLFGNSTGAFECIPCLAGRFQEFSRRSFCGECIPGRYSGVQADTCLKCSEGRIAPYSGSADCFACPNNAGSSEDRTKCICSAGYYSNRTSPTSSDFTCKKCPIGAECIRSGITWESLETSVGYWRASVKVDRFYRCQFLASCLGGRNSTCAYAKVGPICSLCEKGFETFGSACRPCGSEQASTAVFVLMIFVITGLMLGMYYAVLNMDKQTVMKARRQMEGGDQAVLQAEVLDMLKDDTIKEESTVANGPSRPPNFIYKLKILLGFFQIAVGIAFTIEIPWPDTFKQFISLFNIANFDLVQWTRVGCVVETNFYSKHLMVCIMPIGFFSALTVFYLLPQYLLKLRASRISPQKAQESAWSYTIAVRKFWKMTLFTMFLIYPQVSSIIVRLYACITVEGETYLASDFSILCSTQKWKDRAQLNIPFVILYPFGFLGFVAFILFRKRHELQKPENLIQFGFLYAAYAHDRWWFELLDMLHRMVMTSMIALLPQAYALPTILLILSFHAGVILVTNPYTRKSDDLLHLLVQTSLFVMVLAGYVYVNLVVIADDIDSALSVIFIGMTVSLMAFVVISIGLVLRKYLISWRKKRRAQRLQGGKGNKLAKLLEMTTNATAGAQSFDTAQDTTSYPTSTNGVVSVAAVPTNTNDDDEGDESASESNDRPRVWETDPKTEPNTLRLSAGQSIGGISALELNRALRPFDPNYQSGDSRAGSVRASGSQLLQQTIAQSTSVRPSVIPLSMVEEVEVHEEEVKEDISQKFSVRGSAVQVRSSVAESQDQNNDEEFKELAARPSSIPVRSSVRASVHEPTPVVSEDQVNVIVEDPVIAPQPEEDNRNPFDEDEE